MKSKCVTQDKIENVVVHMSCDLKLHSKQVQEVVKSWKIQLPSVASSLNIPLCTLLPCSIQKSSKQSNVNSPLSTHNCQLLRRDKINCLPKLTHIGVFNLQSKPVTVVNMQIKHFIIQCQFLQLYFLLIKCFESRLQGWFSKFDSFVKKFYLFFCFCFFSTSSLPSVHGLVLLCNLPCCVFFIKFPPLNPCSRFLFDLCIKRGYFIDAI